MPKCFYCGTGVPGPELKPHNGELSCTGCCTPSEVIIMADKARKPVVSIQVFEAGQNEEGESNYDIEVSAQLGGLNLSFQRNTDQIRKYFTEKKVKDEQKRVAKGQTKLTSVKD